MNNKKVLMLVASLTLLVWMSPALAKDHEENDGLAQLVVITPKEGQSEALEKAITNYHHYMADKKGAWRYQWHSIITGPNTGKYIARSGNHNWEDFDAEHDWDEKAGDKFVSEVKPYIEDMDFMITRVDDELGIWPDSMDGYEYFSVTDWYVRPGQYGAFKQGLEKIDKILKETEWPSYYAFDWTVSGGKGGEVALVSPRKNFADMAPKEPSFFKAMSEALGEEEAEEFLKDFGATYKVGRNRLVKYRSKLSDYGDGK